MIFLKSIYGFYENIFEIYVKKLNNFSEAGTLNNYLQSIFKQNTVIRGSNLRLHRIIFIQS